MRWLGSPVRENLPNIGHAKDTERRSSILIYLNVRPFLFLIVKAKKISFGINCLMFNQIFLNNFHCSKKVLLETPRL